MTAEQMASTFSGARRIGREWYVPCPIHEADGKRHKPSLSITDRGGKVLVTCRAGCDQRSVVAALRERGLWESGNESAWREWRDGIRYPAEWGTPVREYRYTDESGIFLFSAVRFEPKSFRPGYYDNGRWTWKKHPKPVLYHLPEVLEAAIVFVVEGERDCETLREWGFVATTAAFGANSPWLDSYTAALSGRECIIIPDNDAPGLARGTRIARALVGVAAKVTLLEIEGAKDITEWFEQGHSECELIAALEGCHARS